MCDIKISTEEQSKLDRARIQPTLDKIKKELASIWESEYDEGEELWNTVKFRERMVDSYVKSISKIMGSEVKVIEVKNHETEANAIQVTIQIPKWVAEKMNIIEDCMEVE